MAKAVLEITLGIDVAKDELVICDWETEQVTQLRNEPDDIKAWLGAFYGPVRIAIEPTSRYHLQLLEQAHARGWTVYLVNPRQLAHYRQAIGARNKTDAADAWLLARYLAHESTALRAFKPLSGKAQRLWALIKRRGTISNAQQALQQSFKHCQLSIRALCTEFRRVIARLDRHILSLIRELGWWADYQLCLSMPGVGPANAAALTTVFHRGAFAGADAFIAFIGFDVRLRESGKCKGKRKLSKCGEAEVRRLLYCAAQAARCYRPFDLYYQNQLDKGLSKTAAKVILARKIARIAFALLNKRTSFKKDQLAYSQAP